MNFDKYLDPPDEPEAVYCNDCGAEMEGEPAFYRGGMPYMYCANKFCPAKHDGVAKEMAVYILEQQDMIDRLRMGLKKALS